MRGLVLSLVIVSMLLTGCSSAEDDVRPKASGAIATAADILDRYIDVPANGNVVELDLYAKMGVPYTPYEGTTLYGMAFGFKPDGSDASIPGPEIRLKQGDTLRARLHVSADNVQPHTIHWHGITLPWAMDGVPMMTQDVVVGANSVYTYEWVAREPGTYWYHCHVEAPAHVDLGMFGALIVEPADKTQDLPYDREYTLLLHETDSRTAEYFGHVFGGRTPTVDPYREHPLHAIERVKKNAEFMTDIAGFIAYGATGQENWAENAERDYYPFESIRYRPLYDTFMINGKSYPDTEPVLIQEGETIRIRLINAGTQAHTMHLHGHHFLVTHKDGYPLQQPYAADTVLLGSGERYDIYVVGHNPGHWDFHDHGGGYAQGGFASNAYAFPGGMATMLAYEDFKYADLPGPDLEGATVRDLLPFAPSYKGHHTAPDLWAPDRPAR